MEDFAPMNKEDSGKELKDDTEKIGLKDNVTSETDDVGSKEAGVLQCR